MTNPKIIIDHGSDGQIAIVSNAFATDLVRARFNVSGNPDVDTVKTLAAALITVIDEYRTYTGDKAAERELGIAVTDIQSASMFAVAAITRNL